MGDMEIGGRLLRKEREGMLRRRAMTPRPKYKANALIRSREAVPQQFKYLDGGTAGQIPGFPKRSCANRVEKKSTQTTGVIRLVTTRGHQKLSTGMGVRRKRK